MAFLLPVLCQGCPPFTLQLEGCICLLQDFRVKPGVFSLAERSSMYISSGFSLDEALPEPEICRVCITAIPC